MSYTTNEVAQKLGITKDTLFYYEKEGLLPLIKRDKLNRQFYSEYPDFKDCDQILKTLQLIGIMVPVQDDYCDCAIFLVFNCNWDKENGVGVCLIGDTIEAVGFQGIAL